MEAKENTGEARLFLSGLYQSSCCRGGGGNWPTGPAWWEYAPDGSMEDRWGK